MLLILEIAVGIVLGGLMLYWLYWLLAPESATHRRERKLVRSLTRFVQEEALRQKNMTPEEREKYIEQRSKEL
jgi:hypothetical protein